MVRKAKSSKTSHVSKYRYDHSSCDSQLQHSWHILNMIILLKYSLSCARLHAIYMYMYGVVTSGRADREEINQLDTSKVFSSQSVTATYSI